MEKAEVPAAYTKTVPQPPLQGETFEGALKTIPVLRGALETCNGRLEDVRKDYGAGESDESGG